MGIPEVQILCIGYELLNGKTLNTNAQWLSAQLTSLGFNVRRVTAVGDRLEDISNAITEMLSRSPSVIVTTGGLGPTFDDLTLEAVAMALSTPLEINKQALSMVTAKYRKAGSKSGPIALTRARVKMARLPRGARPLRNTVGTAPGSEITHGQTRIYCLPGVPAEMMAIFSDSVTKIIGRPGKKPVTLETRLKAYKIEESTLAPISKMIVKKYGVYVKSHPQMSEFVKPWLEIHVNLSHPDGEKAETILRKAVKELLMRIENAGGVVAANVA